MTSAERLAFTQDAGNGIYHAHFDSGATLHLTPYRSDFETLKPTNVIIAGFNGSKIPAQGVGSVRIRISKARYILKEVYWVPQACLRLISVGRLCNHDHCVEFVHNTCHVYHKSDMRRQLVLLSGTHNAACRTLYTIKGQVEAYVKKSPEIAASAIPIAIWHSCYGHANYKTLKHASASGAVEGMPINSSLPPSPCDGCILAKQSKTPMPKVREGEKAKERLDRVLYFFDQLFVTRHARFFLTPDLSVSDQTRFIACGWPRVNPGLMKSWSKKYSIRRPAGPICEALNTWSFLFHEPDRQRNVHAMGCTSG
jgi:hypothetical protein